MRTAFYRATLAGVYLAGFCLIGWLAWQGRDFYLSEGVMRPRHEAYWDLKPGGRLGVRYGIAGASLMVVMLVYSVRKRFRPLRKAGSLRTWLDFHIVCGVFGPLFILLHSSFKVGGLVAVSFWSMVVVAGSGVLGRFLYLQIPRRRSGDELGLEEAEGEIERLGSELRDRFGVSASAMERLDEIARRHAPAATGLLALLLRLPVDGARLRLDLARAMPVGENLPPAAARALRRVVRQRAGLRRRILLWSRLQELFHYWHVLHKPFALLMYLFMAVHITVALATGYGWSPS
jgi:hypothetical protein